MQFIFRSLGFYVSGLFLRSFLFPTAFLCISVYSQYLLLLDSIRFDEDLSGYTFACEWTNRLNRTLWLILLLFLFFFVRIEKEKHHNAQFPLQFTSEYDIHSNRTEPKVNTTIAVLFTQVTCMHTYMYVKHFLPRE